jgi:tetratricopeptide (TPR) repeat protein
MSRARLVYRREQAVTSRWKRVGATAGFVVVALVASLTLWTYFAAPIVFPAPRVDNTQAVTHADFVGAERCASCHTAEYSVWKRSTHGRAGGPASADQVIASFNKEVIRFADARVIPRIRGGVYEFVVLQRDEPPRTFRIDGVIGGGHIHGGGTQGFVTKLDDGTMRFLPFEWSRQGRTWFCNTNSRAGRGWTPITPATRLAECGDWPPVRVLGDVPRYANCQSCHASQASVSLDTVTHTYKTQVSSLDINCESCHGPGRRHVELAERGAVPNTSDVGFASPPLAALDKDASSRMCYQCHAVKDQLRDGFLSGDSLHNYYSTKFPLLGDRPLFPDGRVRTFAYQEGQQYSDCYLNGGVTCVSCHDPHSQGYRTVSGEPLSGRFDDKQCTSCHASKADEPSKHTHHLSPIACTSCHMPLRQEPDTRTANSRYANAAVVQYKRSDHTISIPRPALDASLGLVSACAECHATMSTAQQERQIHEWWGDVKPIAPVVAAQLRLATGQSESTAADMLLGETGVNDAHAFARFAGVARFLETYVKADAGADQRVGRRLEQLARSPDDDIRAVALAALHLANGGDRATRRTLARALRAAGSRGASLRSRWALALGFMGDRYAADGNLADAVAAYQRALEVRPTSARLFLSLANAQRDAGDLHAAIASYRQSTALDAGAPIAWVNFGIALAAAGDTAGAISALNRAATLDPSEPLTWFNLGNIMLVRGDLPSAAAMYGKTAALDPSIALAHFQLARVDLLMKDYQAALADLRRGLAFDSSDVSARQMAAELRRLVTGRNGATRREPKP